MSLIYTMARPAAKTLAKRQLEEGLKDPDAYRKKVKELQAKPLPLDRLHKQYAFEQEYADGTVYVASELKALEGNCERYEPFLPGHYYWSREPGMKRYYQRDWFEYIQHPADSGLFGSRGTYCCGSKHGEEGYSFCHRSIADVFYPVLR